MPPVRLAVASSAPRPRPALRTDRPAASAASRWRPAEIVETRAACAAETAWPPVPRNRAAAANIHTVAAWSAGAASSSTVPMTRTSMEAATAALRAPRSSQRPTTGMQPSPATTPAVMARPAVRAARCSTSMPYSSRNGRSSPAPMESTARATTYRGPPTARTRARTPGFRPDDEAAGSGERGAGGEDGADLVMRPLCGRLPDRAALVDGIRQPNGGRYLRPAIMEE